MAQFRLLVKQFFMKGQKPSPRLAGFQNQQPHSWKFLEGSYRMISSMAAMSSAAMVTFDFSIKMFLPVIIYDGMTRIPL